MPFAITSKRSKTAQLLIYWVSIDVSIIDYWFLKKYWFIGYFAWKLQLEGDL